jgi:hypothetical protein
MDQSRKDDGGDLRLGRREPSDSRRREWVNGVGTSTSPGPLSMIFPRALGTRTSSLPKGS